MKRLKRTISFVLALLMLVISFPQSAMTVLAAELYNMELAGNVYDSEGRGLAGVSVYVYDLTEHELLDYYRTNNNGEWNCKECGKGNREAS